MTSFCHFLVPIFTYRKSGTVSSESVAPFGRNQWHGLERNIYVIHLLVKVCGLDSIQAEQCMLISHHKGKCEVKKGSKEELIKLKNKTLY